MKAALLLIPSGPNAYQGVSIQFVCLLTIILLAVLCFISVDAVSPMQLPFFNELSRTAFCLFRLQLQGRDLYKSPLGNGFKAYLTSRKKYVMYFSLLVLGGGSYILFLYSGISFTLPCQFFY